jgi:hyperosmotically inducible periplasmic protein
MLSKFLVGGALVTALAGCTPQSRDEYSAAGHEAAQAVTTDAGVAARATKAAANAADNSLKGSGTDVKKIAGNAENAAMAPKVKVDLMAAKGLDASHISVSDNGKTISLNGSVPTAQQKSLAGQHAKSALGPGYQVQNNLKVQG